jgi:hypothetical protein
MHSRAVAENILQGSVRPGGASSRPYDVSALRPRWFPPKVEVFIKAPSPAYNDLTRIDQRLFGKMVIYVFHVW